MFSSTFITLSLMFTDLFINIAIYYFNLDVQLNSYPASNKIKDCSFPTVSNVFHRGWGSGTVWLISYRLLATTNYFNNIAVWKSTMGRPLLQKAGPNVLIQTQNPLVPRWQCWPLQHCAAPTVYRRLKKNSPDRRKIIIKSSHTYRYSYSTVDENLHREGGEEAQHAVVDI